MSLIYLLQVCLSEGYCTLDPRLLVTKLTRAVGQECWPRCGSYPALKSISDKHPEMCASPKRLLHCSNPGFGFHTDKIQRRQSRAFSWQIINVLHKQVLKESKQNMSSLMQTCLKQKTAESTRYVTVFLRHYGSKGLIMLLLYMDHSSAAPL